MHVTPIEFIKALRVIHDLAAASGQSMFEVHWTIKASIDRAWQEAWAPGNLAAQLHWQQIFPGTTQPPSVIQFIVGTARQMMDGKDPPYLL